MSEQFQNQIENRWNRCKIDSANTHAWSLTFRTCYRRFYKKWIC